MCGFLEKLEPGDVIQGFPFIDTNGSITLIPPSANQNEQFTRDEVKETENIASMRIHIERVIQRLKMYRILSHQISRTLFPIIDQLVHVCAVLVNLQSPIINVGNNQEEEGEVKS